MVGRGWDKGVKGLLEEAVEVGGFLIEGKFLFGDGVVKGAPCLTEGRLFNIGFVISFGWLIVGVLDDCVEDGRFLLEEGAVVDVFGLTVLGLIWGLEAW
jgi:hypothetical protein